MKPKTKSEDFWINLKTGFPHRIPIPTSRGRRLKAGLERDGNNTTNIHSNPIDLYLKFL